MTSKLEAVIGVWLGGGEQRMQNSLLNGNGYGSGEGGFLGCTEGKQGRIPNPNHSIGVSIGKASHLNLKYSPAWFLLVENSK